MIELRPLPFLRRFYTLFTGFFAVLALGSLGAGLTHWNAPSQRLASAALLFGVFWGVSFALCAFGLLASTRRWRIDRHGIRRLGLFPRRLAWKEISRVDVRKDERDYTLTLYGDRGSYLRVDLASFGADGRAFVEAVTTHLLPDLPGGMPLSTEIPDLNKGLAKTLAALVIVLTAGALAYGMLVPLVRALF
ncbi:MAG: hypothetical protein ACT4PY_09765 [Armatimonadota bacterium]